MRNVKCEYIWVDGTEPTSELRSKTRVFRISEEDLEGLNKMMSEGNSPHEMIPVWGFDGSSTNQADSSNSDCALRPVLVTADPLRPGSLLVLCEVFNSDLTPHTSNTRSIARQTLSNTNPEDQPRVGFEQEYVIMQSESGLPLDAPLGWPTDGEPKPQGPYYCGSGGDKVAGRQISEMHLDACLSAGLTITGVNAEVMLGQWEYQVGGPDVHALIACDHLILSRYILNRVSERFGTWISLDPKPVSGDWNGSGLHTNFSTDGMRKVEGGLDKIKAACETLGRNTESHLSVYGEGIERRVTGEHETQSYDTFSWGVSDRGASVRIPWHVEKNGCGYLEDRRPNSNADPYLVLNSMLTTLCAKNETASSLEEAEANLAKQEELVRQLRTSGEVSNS